MMTQSDRLENPSSFFFIRRKREVEGQKLEKCVNLLYQMCNIHQFNYLGDEDREEEAAPDGKMRESALPSDESKFDSALALANTD